mgnify:CR=1 FL=1
MAAITQKELAPFAKTLGTNLQGIAEIMNHLTAFAAQGKYNRFLSDATVFMDYMSTIVIGWQWLKMATVAKNALLTGNKTQTEAFYEAKVHTMKFFFKYEMPKTTGLAEEKNISSQLGNEKYKIHIVEFSRNETQGTHIRMISALLSLSA